MKSRFKILFLGVVVASWASAVQAQKEMITPDELALVEAVEKARISAVNKVIGSVVAIYGTTKDAGGGSGVVFDESGLVLTNHHVVASCGVNGFAGLADGNLYAWDLIGTDPGGDLAIIRLKGKDRFPASPLGNSDNVRVGQWVFAMGNPFVLTEDQVPTVTLGIVSGIERYQSGAGKNELVYGNCIQIDSSINPGNSGGPLFNMQGEIIGINGRGSFHAQRGRVNVGLGYAISSNQIKNFFPDLLATKLVQHGTLDAQFTDREGKVVCSTLNLDSPAAQAGLELGDELLEFEGRPIRIAYQFTNLICTLPESWPVTLRVRHESGREETIALRLQGLPYEKPKPPPNQVPDDATPEQKEAMKRAKAMVRLLSHDAGVIRDKSANRRSALRLLQRWKASISPEADAPPAVHLRHQLAISDKILGTQQVWMTRDGRYRLDRRIDGRADIWFFDGQQHWRIECPENEVDSAIPMRISATAARLNLQWLAVMTLAEINAGLADAMPGLEGLGKLLIDGSAKANNLPAVRFRFTGERSETIFLWMTLDDAAGDDRCDLAKVATDIDGTDGMHHFDSWQMQRGWLIPQAQRVTRGLEERPRFEFRDEKVAFINEVDDSLFAGPTDSETDSEAETDTASAPTESQDSEGNDE